MPSLLSGAAETMWNCWLRASVKCPPGATEACLHRRAISTLPTCQLPSEFTCEGSWKAKPEKQQGSSRNNRGPVPAWPSTSFAGPILVAEFLLALAKRPQPWVFLEFLQGPLTPISYYKADQV